MPKSGSEEPTILLIAGPNGAGKSTVSRGVALGAYGITHFANADVIAKGLAAFASEDVAIRAGRVMLEWLKNLGNQGKSFAFETTLASKSYARWISELKHDKGYRFAIEYVSLPSVEYSLNRVTKRVASGGTTFLSKTSGADSSEVCGTSSTSIFRLQIIGAYGIMVSRAMAHAQ